MIIKMLMIMVLIVKKQKHGIFYGPHEEDDVDAWTRMVVNLGCCRAKGLDGYKIKTEGRGYFSSFLPIHTSPSSPFLLLGKAAKKRN